MVTKGEKWGGGINQEVEINMYILLYIKQIINKDCIAQETLLNTL